MSKSLITWTIGLLLLVLAGPAIGQTDEEIEELFWKSVECQSKRQVQAYLEVYPAGAYVAEAHACLEGQLGLDRAARRLVQHGLTALDYSVGAADGLFGPATRKAMREWQAGKGFTGTGYLTREQADALITQGSDAVAEQRQREETQREAEEAERRQAAEAERQAREAAARAEAKRQRQAQEAAAQAEAERQRQTCTGRSEGAECFIELAGRPGCYVFTFNFLPGGSMTWAGECTDGLAHGMGTLTFTRNSSKTEYSGLIQDGKRQGHFVRRRGNGDVGEGPFVDGKPHGHWVIRQADGDVWEGPRVSGKRQGRWVIRYADGDVWEGSYVDDKLHGHWVNRQVDGDIYEGPYVDDKQHGRWILRKANGSVREFTYVNGERQ